MDLAQALKHHQYLREQLRIMFPHEDEASLADTLEGESNLDEALLRVIRACDDDAALIVGLTLRMDAMKARKDRLERRIDRQKEIVADVMAKAGMTRIVGPDMTVSVAKRAKSVIIIDEEVIPRAYFRSAPPPPDKIDKAALKEALEDGISVPGAALSNGGFGINIRRS